MRLRDLGFGCLLTAMLSLAGCAPQGMRLVDTVDAPKFVTMSRAMRAGMLRKHMVDHRGDWYSPAISLLPRDAGRALAERLSPSFLPEFSRSSASSFLDAMGQGTHVRTERFRAVFSRDGISATLELVAVTDWDGDGKGDWMVSCRLVRASAPLEVYEHFMVVTDTDAPVMFPRPLLELKHAGGKTQVMAEPFHAELVESAAFDYMQGQIDVTQAPDSETRKKLEEAGSVRQSSLSM